MPFRPKRILWPTDFSPLANKAGQYARTFREQFDSELHIVHVCLPVVSPEIAVPLPTGIELSVNEQELTDAAQRDLRHIVDERFDGDDSIVTAVMFGNPWSMICDYAGSENIDLIVVGTHGFTGIRHALIGSTAERIVQHAPCPVLTIKAGEDEFKESGK